MCAIVLSSSACSHYSRTNLQGNSWFHPGESLIDWASCCKICTDGVRTQRSDEAGASFVSFMRLELPKELHALLHEAVNLIMNVHLCFILCNSCCSTLRSQSSEATTKMGICFYVLRGEAFFSHSESVWSALINAKC